MSRLDWHASRTNLGVVDELSVREWLEGIQDDLPEIDLKLDHIDMSYGDTIFKTNYDVDINLIEVQFLQSYDMLGNLISIL